MKLSMIFIALFGAVAAQDKDKLVTSASMGDNKISVDGREANMTMNGATINGSMSMQGNITWTNLTVEGDGFSYKQE